MTMVVYFFCAWEPAKHANRYLIACLVTPKCLLAAALVAPKTNLRRNPRLAAAPAALQTTLSANSVLLPLSARHLAEREFRFTSYSIRNRKDLYYATVFCFSVAHYR